MSVFKNILAALVLCVVTVSAQASTISFNWGDGSNGQSISADTGWYTDFNNATNTFNPIANASTVTLSGGWAMVHSHGQFDTPALSALINGTWSQIWSANLTPWNDDAQLNSVGTIALPTVGTLTALQFNAGPIFQAYHGMNSLNIAVATGVATPEAHEWALIIVALAATVVAFRRRGVALV